MGTAAPPHLPHFHNSTGGFPATAQPHHKKTQPAAFYEGPPLQRHPAAADKT
jgi:hypothetical protein